MDAFASPLARLSSDVGEPAVGLPESPVDVAMRPACEASHTAQAAMTSTHAAQPAARVATSQSDIAKLPMPLAKSRSDAAGSPPRLARFAARLFTVVSAIRTPVSAIWFLRDAR